MRQSRSSGSAEGVMGNHDPYSDMKDARLMSDLPSTLIIHL